MIANKKKYGQVFTSQVISDFMADLVSFGNNLTVLDPAAGNGNFFKSLEKLKKGSYSYYAYDIDFLMANELKKADSFSVKIYNEDYLLSKSINKYDIIICNPPYNKFQNIPNRKEYTQLFKEKYNITLSGYSNIYVYFLIKSINDLNINGRCAYLIPYEFLNAGYGNPIKEYIIKTKFLKSIYKFSNKIAPFPDATTTSCIIFLGKKEHRSIDFISIENIEEINNKKFEHMTTFSYNQISPCEKWNRYFNCNNIISNSYNNLTKFSCFAKAKRGIATGNNNYFALSKSQITENGLSDAACLKCVTKSADVNSLVFTDTDFNNLYNKNKKMFLFNGVNSQSKADYEYIKYGEASKVNNSYLTSHRNPWYLLENKEVAPIWISVFSRNKIKVVRNETVAKNLTTFHGIYTYTSDSDFQNILFCYLLTPIGQNLLLDFKREYGNGLDKFEPNDINNSQAINLSLLSSEDKAAILSLYEGIKTSINPDKYILLLNDIFKAYLK